LINLETLPTNEVKLDFEDGFSTAVDLVVGADGIRSVRIPYSSCRMSSYPSFPQVVREAVFPNHTITYSGKIGYRTIFPISHLAHIPDLPRKTLFWHGPDTSLFTTPIGDGLFEVSGRGPEPEELVTKWGRPATKEAMMRHFVVRCWPFRPFPSFHV
jgi:salicylate hydroxylase